MLFALSLSSGLRAQTVELTVFDWNVKSFEQTDKSGETSGFPVEEFVSMIAAAGADIVCLNEFETATSRMGQEKMSEMASELGMYAYYIKSYPKDVGYYGNVILSKYPVIASASHLFPYENVNGEGRYDQNSGTYLEQYGSDQRSVGYVDIFVPISSTDSRIIRIVCTHFDHDSTSEGPRTVQAQESVEFASLASPIYPTIFCGDLNTTSETTLEALYSAGDHVGVSWVDHIFTFPKNAWTASDFTTISNVGTLSDHSAIVAVLTLNE